jgi:hypothetical protein
MKRSAATRFGKRRRRDSLSTDSAKHIPTNGAICRIGSKLSLQRGGKFREGTRNGLRQNEDQNKQKPKIERATRMKQTFLYTSLAVMALAVTTGAAPERCEGTVQLTSQSNFQVRQAGRQTFIEFDFTGLHDICLADHSVVTGSVEGHLVQRISANGDFSLTFDEVLSYNGGTLGYRGEGGLTGDNWQSNVMTVGLGTGPLAGIHGQGTFVFTGPASLADVIYYVYAP